MAGSPQQQESAAVRTEPLPEETVEMVAAMLRVLGDPTRIRLIEELNERGGATVSALTACFGVSQQRVSQQLSILHQAGIIRRRRDGIWVRYELVDFSGLWLVRQIASAIAAGSPSSAV
jgi:DNA-binding transcriptional ArsR family regulator